MWLIVAGPLVLALIIGGVVWVTSGAGKAAEAHAPLDVTDGFVSNLYVNGVKPITVTGGSNAVMGYVGMSADGQKHAVLAQTEGFAEASHLALVDATSKELQQIGVVTACTGVTDDTIYCSFVAKNGTDFWLRPVSLLDGSIGPGIDTSTWGDASDPVPVQQILDLGPSLDGGRVFWVKRWTLGAQASWFAAVIGADGSVGSVQAYDQTAGWVEGCVLATTRDKVMCQTSLDSTTSKITVLNLTTKTQAISESFGGTDGFLLTADAALVDQSGGPFGLYGGQGIRLDFDLNVSQVELHSIMIEPAPATNNRGNDIVYSKLDDLLSFQPSDYSNALVDDTGEPVATTELNDEMLDQVKFLRTGQTIDTHAGVWTVSHDGNVLVDGSGGLEPFTIWSAETGAEIYTSESSEGIGFDLRQGVIFDADRGKLTIYAPLLG